MKIIIPGGSGQIGQLMTRSFLANQHEVVILTRSDSKTAKSPSRTEHLRTLNWDSKNIGPWADEFNGADVIINLAGRSVNCRYNDSNRKEMIQSRIDSTKVVGEAIRLAANPPRVWLQASTATIYADRYDAPNDEATGIIKDSEQNKNAPWQFSVDIAKAWENTAQEAKTPHTRKVLLRSAMTMSPDQGGVFDVMLGLTRKGLGGTSGNGKQFVSWIHETDFINAINWLIEKPIDGAVNLTSPNPLPNSVFMRSLRQAWGTKIGLPATKWMLEIGAVFLKTETELILKSRRVVPRRLLDAGFEFQFPHWPDAAKELCKRWRELQYLSSISENRRFSP